MKSLVDLIIYLFIPSLIHFFIQLLNQLKCIHYVMRCTIWYHLYNLKNVKKKHGGVLLLVCNFSISSTPPWVFFTFFKLSK